MSGITDTGKKPRLGAVKHCSFGKCNCDSRPGRPGYRPGLRFLPFPKPCLTYRKMNVLETEERKNHLKKCHICKKCQTWMKMCRRTDSKWETIANITKDTYICEDHFIDIDEMHLPLPRPASEVVEIKAMKKRGVNQDFHFHSKRRKNTVEDTEFQKTYENAFVNFVKIGNVNENNYGKVSAIKKEEIEIFKCDKSTQATTFRFDDEEALRIEIAMLKKEISVLKKKLQEPKNNSKKTKNPMDVFENDLKSNNIMCKFYTGFDYTQIVKLFNFMSFDKTQPILDKLTNKKKITPIQELILTLVRLRTGHALTDLSHHFQLSFRSVSRIITTWIHHMFTKFTTFRPLIMPSKEKTSQTLPKSFDKLKNIRVIIDCAEIFGENHTTVKLLIGCTPNGAVCFVSDLFKSSTSYREIVEKSKLLDFLEEGDLVLADRGFIINDSTSEINVSLKIPAFLKERGKLTDEEEIITKQRSHVEHVVGRIKQYKLLKKSVSPNMRAILSQAVFVCASLVNFQTTGE